MVMKTSSNAARVNHAPPRSIPFLFFLLLLLSSGAIVYSTAENIRAVEELSLQALRNIGFSLASSADNALHGGHTLSTNEFRAIFADRVVAYALVVGADGTVLFHTNPGLVGSRLPGDEVDRLLKAGSPSGQRSVLQTGAPVYEFNYALPGRERAPRILRLVLHTTVLDRAVSKAKLAWWTVVMVLFLLWTAGILLWAIFVRYLRMRDELDEGHRMALIGQMTALLAHEIRNALGSIKGYAQWMDERTDADSAIKPGVAAVLSGSGRIEGLVDDLLLFSREETYDMTYVDLCEVVAEAARVFTPSWTGRVEYRMDRPFFVKADREKLFRIMGNGIRNALEAMGDDGTLVLSVREEGRWVVATVEDTGQGISADHISRLFTPFFTTKARGTGLGLAYARKLVGAMGGTVDLHNREGGIGAAFVVRLPRKGEKDGQKHTDS